MTKSVKSLLMAAVMGLGLATSALAADTSVTVVARDTQFPVGITPKSGYAEFTATSGAASAGSYTADLPVPNGASVKQWNCTSRDTSGNAVPRKVTISGNVITVATATGQASGTLATGDVTKCDVKY